MQMTVLLKQQAQLEHTFLQRVNTKNFEKLCLSHINFFKNHLHLRTNYHQFAERTQRATQPIQYSEDLITYITLYGLGHYQRMQYLLATTQPFSGYALNTPLKFAVVDYGCGQGIASLALIDHLMSSPYTVEALDILLIEPSAIALNRAKLWITTWLEKHPHIEVNLTVRQQYIDELDTDFLAFNKNEYVYIHLFSNILDLHYLGSFNISPLCHKINNQPGEHLFIAISPNYFATQVGINLLHQKLKPLETYINGPSSVPIKEFNFKIFDFYQRQAPVRSYVAYQQISKTEG